MVLFPISQSDVPSSDGVIPAWEAIEHKQREAAQDWWLVSQPDHAAISASLARQIDSPLFPGLDDDVVQAIALHDDGWANFDSSPHRQNGRPASFIDAGVSEFLEAWRGSIDRAQQHSAIGGILVSEHFCRIALARPASSAEAQDLIADFLRQESERQARLRTDQAYGGEEIRALVDVLQFCDLLSLYLCCGAKETVVFPQKFQGHELRLRRQGDFCRVEPSTFGPGLSLAVPARKFSDFVQGHSIPVLLG